MGPYARSGERRLPLSSSGLCRRGRYDITHLRGTGQPACQFFKLCSQSYAEGKGFEPLCAFALTVFKTGTFGQLSQPSMLAPTNPVYPRCSAAFPL